MGLQLTRGGEYGIRAMIYVAQFSVGHVSSLRDVSSAQNIPESFLAKIFQNLVRTGLATSRRGAHGGFSLARPATEITARQVIEAVDGPVSLNGCVLYPDECHRSSGCPMHTAWERAQKSMLDVLDSVSLAQLATAAAQDATSPV